MLAHKNIGIFAWFAVALSALTGCIPLVDVSTKSGNIGASLRGLTADGAGFIVSDMEATHGITTVILGLPNPSLTTTHTLFAYDPEAGVSRPTGAVETEDDYDMIDAWPMLRSGDDRFELQEVPQPGGSTSSVRLVDRTTAEGTVVSFDDAGMEVAGIALALSPDGRQALWGAPQAGAVIELRRFDRQTGENAPLGELAASDFDLMAISNDGRTVLAAQLVNDAAVRVLDPDSGAWSSVALGAAGEGIFNASMTGDGRFVAAELVSVAEYRAYDFVFDLPTVHHVRILDRRSGGVTTLELPE